ncbi:hypothetical protein BHZ80_29110 [Salmonella enterica]|nr:hypothetical protein [Salmonella enterica]EAA9599175.1 hypothetical protein [Salmonella enterica]EAO9641851.1 hypothetical protein [Salmonella enterica]
MFMVFRTEEVWGFISRAERIKLMSQALLIYTVKQKVVMMPGVIARGLLSLLIVMPIRFL